MDTPVSFRFSSATVDCHFGAGARELSHHCDRRRTVLLMDENVHAQHARRFRGWDIHVIPPGEDRKVQATVDDIIDGLIRRRADRQSTLVGVGGGVVTDLAGYAASVYMRGIPFGFLPTTLLAMVDASIGGKNGIDVGPYKNMVGVIRQPRFILYDWAFLRTLHEAQWSDGFAEIVKHACIRDAVAFRQLEAADLAGLRRRREVLHGLIERNARLKCTIVRRDEFERGERRLLNFGHTLGHAIETVHGLSHGQAVAVGMVLAAGFSARLLGFRDIDRLRRVLEAFGLPTTQPYDADRVWEVLSMDKKRVGGEMNYVLLERIGRGVVRSVPMRELEGWVRSPS